MVRSASEVEQNIVSVERILNQTEVQPEAPLEIPAEQPQGDWPTSGSIEFWLVYIFNLQVANSTVFFSNYSTKYRPDLDLILKDISLQIVRFWQDSKSLVADPT